MAVKYIYYVVYTFSYPQGGNGNGTLQITAALPLVAQKRIRAVKELITRTTTNQHGVPDILITQMILLRKDGGLAHRARSRKVGVR